MANIPDILSAMLTILENPSVEKGYKALKKCYKQSKRAEDAAAIEYLLEIRFGTDDSDNAQNT